jgi:bifunctional non-homologous end joining protein LigD
MKVEDHPLDYGEFEGVIPEGYGAGIVMLWDRGTWIPESDDVAAALKKGDLKFTLNGYKLKGSWVLVRTGGRGSAPPPDRRGGRWGDPRGDQRSWLLIKHRDDWSGDLDITGFAPKSVKSNGDFEDILAEDTPAVWLSNRPAKGGDSGAMLAAIIERAARLKAGSARPAPSSSAKKPPKKAQSAQPQTPRRDGTKKKNRTTQSTPRTQSKKR